MDENDLEQSELVWIDGWGGSVLNEKIFLEREKDVLQFKQRWKLKTFETIELYMPSVDIPCIWSLLNRKDLDYEYF